MAIIYKMTGTFSGKERIIVEREESDPDIGLKELLCHNLDDAKQAKSFIEDGDIAGLRTAGYHV